MSLKSLSINGFKSFAKKTTLEFLHPIIAIVGPNGSGKSNIVEAFRFVLGEQSMKSMRSQSGHDLIFKGSKNLPRGSFSNVSICFNNSDKVFKLANVLGPDINFNYDNITISREINYSGTGKYLLNGTEVRLKDIHYLLASVNISSYGHHIISQGDADSILNANPKEKREIIEGALGLKIYQYQLKESQQKLEKTKINMQEVSLLRRENAPRLSFLKKHVEKFEKAREFKNELINLYQEYIQKENIYLRKRKAVLLNQKNQTNKELKNIDAFIENNKESTEAGKEIPNKALEDLYEKLKLEENKINEVYNQKNSIYHESGKLEGAIEKLEESQKKLSLSKRCPLCGSEIINPEKVKDNKEDKENELIKLKDLLKSLNLRIDYIIVEEKEILKTIEELKSEINVVSLREEERKIEKERKSGLFKIKQQELLSLLKINSIEEENLLKEELNLENEIKEGSAIINEEIFSHQLKNMKNEINIEAIEALEIDDNKEIAEVVIDREFQYSLKKKIEKLKIKLEEAGLGDEAEIRKEFQNASDRDNFLGKEIEDLSRSIESLNIAIADLKNKLDIEFKDGIEKINVQLREFFSLVFPGAIAYISVFKIKPKQSRALADSKLEDVENSENIDENLENKDFSEEEGIELNISFAHKKVKELHALSGGERSLTAIALLFAMSQVNPPPFLILDETDAALDENNSYKFGNMLEKLSKNSQLIVITHNRTTMSHAGVLYGVTLDNNGASKLLSVQLKKAEELIS